MSLAVKYHNGMPDPVNMASSGKKSKKTKGKTIPLTNFLQEGGVVPVIPSRNTSNWADEVEDSYDGYDGGRFSKPPKAVILPTAPKAARGLDDYTDKIPQNPPYVVYLSNLPYDVEEDEIADYFCNLKISKMNIPKESEGSRARGYGYVEFEDKESLIEALTKPLTHLKGRRIRIDVATNTDSDRRRGGRMDMNRDRSDRPEVSMGDWRSSSGRTEQEPARRGGYRNDGFSRDREGGGGGGGGFNRDRDGGGSGGGFSREREPGQDKPGAWRDGNDRPSFNDRYREDKGPITRDGPPRDGRDRYERDGDRRFGGRRNDERNGGFSRGGNNDQDRGGESRARPKLNLAPRTKPLETPLPPPQGEPEAERAAPKPAPVPAASIFGNAKPVDTAAKERLIEERLAKQSTDVDRDDRRRDNGRGRKGSPERRRYTSPRRSADRRTPEGDSPDRNRGRRDDKRGPPPASNDKPAVKNEKRPPREITERSMPKMQSPEPVNIVAKNQYSFLAAEEEEGGSD